MKAPESPRLFLVDGYALIYRAFFALISRPLTTSKGENTSASWGIANFLQRLITKHQPEYLGWVHDSGLSFRHERYPAYKATREKLTEELQSDFDRGMDRIREMLDAYRIPIMTLPGYEADDVIGTLVAKSVDAGVNVVVVSGDKDFQQLVKPGVWLLNPGRGGPANVEEHWVGVENGDERLGVAPEFVTDYLALVGDSSDNIPGVKGIGDKTASELVKQYGHLESILAHAGEITKKRPREALLEHADNARLSKELVTIRDDLAVPFDLESLRIKQPDHNRLRDLFIELEFHSLAKDSAAQAPAEEKPRQSVNYVTVDTIEAMEHAIGRARQAQMIAIGTETLIDPESPQLVDPLRSSLVSIAIAVGEGEAYYFPLQHKLPQGGQGELLVDAAGDRSATDAPEDRGLIRGGDEPFAETTAKEKEDQQRFVEHCRQNAAGEHANQCSQSSSARFAGDATAQRSSGRSDHPKDRAELEVRSADAAQCRSESRRAGLRHHARELCARSRTPLAWPGCAGARVPRPHDDLVHRSVWQRPDGNSFRRVSCPGGARLRL